jgi:hypothetical protein
VRCSTGMDHSGGSPVPGRANGAGGSCAHATTMVTGVVRCIETLLTRTGCGAVELAGATTQQSGRAAARITSGQHPWHSSAMAGPAQADVGATRAARSTPATNARIARDLRILVTTVTLVHRLYQSESSAQPKGTSLASSALGEFPATNKDVGGPTSLFVVEGVDRVEFGGADGRVQSKDDADAYRNQARDYH